MSKILVVLVSTLLYSCSAISRHTSLGSAQRPLDLKASCGECPPCPDVPCPPECQVDCGDECTVVCVHPVYGECVVTLRCHGDTCSVVSCEPLGPGETAPPNARRVDCAEVCGTNCRE